MSDPSQTTPPREQSPEENQQTTDDGADAVEQSTEEYTYMPMIRKMALLGAAVVCVFYMVWWVTAYFMQSQIIFPRQQLPQVNDGQIPDQIVQYRQPIEGGQAVAWFIPAELTGGITKAPAVIYFHGGGDIIDNQGPIAAGYHQLGIGVLMPEYRGFGRSDGEPTQQNLREDALAFYDQMISRQDVDPDRIIYHGIGVGGAVAADLASIRPPRALILESTFKSGAAVLSEMAIPGFLVTNPYRTDKVLGRLNIPVIIYHGRHDEQIPVEHARTLASIALNAKLFEFDDQLPNFTVLTNTPQFWLQHATLLASVDLIKLRPPVLPAPPVSPAPPAPPAPAVPPATTPPANAPAPQPG